MEEGNQFSLLRSRRFLPLFLTQFANAFNDNLFKNALVVLLTLSLADSALLVNVCAGLFILPFFLFSATAGQLAEKFDKAKMARLVKLVEIAIMAMAGYGFISDNTWLLICSLFLMGTHSAFFGPIKYAILPQHLPSEDLVGANGLIDMGTFLAILFGTILGGLTIAMSGGAHLIAIGILTTAVIGYGFSRFIPAAPATAPGLKLNWNIVTATRDCVRLSRTTRSVFLSILGISWFFMLGATYLTQLPLYVKETLGGQAETITLLLAVFSIGIGTGSLLCERLSGRSIELGLVPFGMIGLTFFGFDLYFAAPLPWEGELRPVSSVLADSYSWRVIFDLFAIGVFGGFYVVPLFAMLQARTAPAERARIIAANNIINSACMVLAAAVGAILLGPLSWTVPQVFLLFAILNLPVAFYIFTLLPEFLMRFLVWVLTSVFYRIERKDLAKIPREGAVLLVCNHVSFVDALIIAGSCRRPVRFVMEYSIYKVPVLNFIFRTAGAVPIDTRQRNPEIYEAAFHRIAGYLRDGEPVCIFPEGRLTSDGEIAEFKAGIVRILSETPTPVVPLALNGLWGSFFSHADGRAMKKLPRRLWARLRIIAGDLIPAEAATPNYLREQVLQLRGPWR